MSNATEWLAGTAQAMSNASSRLAEFADSPGADGKIGIAALAATTALGAALALSPMGSQDAISGAISGAITGFMGGFIPSFFSGLAVSSVAENFSDATARLAEKLRARSAPEAAASLDAAPTYNRNAIHIN